MNNFFKELLRDTSSKISYLAEVMLYARIPVLLKFVYPVLLVDLLLTTCTLCGDLLGDGFTSPAVTTDSLGSNSKRILDRV